jgi:hypothetical protein
MAAIVFPALAVAAARGPLAVGVDARRPRRRGAADRAGSRCGPSALLLPRRRGVHARPLQVGGADVRAADARRLNCGVFLEVLVAGAGVAALAKARPR